LFLPDFFWSYDNFFSYNKNFDKADEPHITNRELNDTQKSPSEEIVLPLELVINKDFKSQESHPDSDSAKYGSSNIYENVTFDNNEEAYESVTNDTVTNDNSNKTYIPRIEPYDIALNIQNHLRNDNDRDSKTLQNSHVKNVNVILIIF